MLDERLSVAPMMEWTDRHYRYFIRGLSKKTVLYTEMVVDDAINHSPNFDILVGTDIEEQPSVIQLGGHNPETLAAAAEVCSIYGRSYDEINLNCGCPSQRVSKRCFGAKLMEEPELVREIVSQMQRRTFQHVTVKCRLGVDKKDSYKELCDFLMACHQGGVKKFIIHSRKCFLKGLTTKQNRDIPPLKYDTVHRLVREFPDLTFVLNGGITSLSQAQSHMSTWKRSDINLDNMGIYSTFDPNILNHEEFDSVSYPAVHGVMIGRAAYNNPLLLANADSQIFHVKDPHVSRRDLLERYISYCEFCQSENGPTKKTFRGTEDVISTSILLKPVHAIMNGCHNSPKYKQLLNDLYVERVKKGIVNPSCREVIEGAIKCISDTDLDRLLSYPQGVNENCNEES